MRIGQIDRLDIHINTNCSIFDISIDIQKINRRISTPTSRSSFFDERELCFYCNETFGKMCVICKTQLCHYHILYNKGDPNCKQCFVDTIVKRVDKHETVLIFICSLMPIISFFSFLAF